MWWDSGVQVVGWLGGVDWLTVIFLLIVCRCAKTRDLQYYEVRV